uniref:JmjC domain-containing protein n=1 Tax=Amorphochlora amoebiformis TaxID=1561963 RepID=A0A7S0H909_9EUKA
MMENVSMYIKLPDLLAKDPISRVANFRSKPKNLTSLPPHKRSEYTTKTTPPGKKVRIGDWRWIQIEPAASGEKLTTDHHHLSLSSTLLSGRRLWCIFPGISGESRDPAPSRVSEDVSEHPERSFPGISRESLGEVSGGLSEIFGVSPGTSRTDNVEKILEPSRTLSQTALEWLEDYTRSSFAKSSLCFWNIQEAGESVVIPSGWRHTSISVEPSVSFRQRFILPSDFSSVVRSSKTSTQIARGRVHSKIVEAIKRLSARSQTDTRDTSN